MLGKLKQISLREVWQKEAYFFTPWLSENLNEIGEAVGLELSLEAMEVPVGPYSADILAKDVGTNKFVVIENQLEKTDHDHLGKCITYASVLDASAVIWIASKFTDEHKKALDWLNDHTSDEIGFYGIQIELWRIDDSQPAVRFNVISEPNIVVRQATQRKEQGELTVARKIQLEFWSLFREKLAETGKIRSLQTPRPQYWFDIALGKSGINLSTTFNTDKNEISLRVYIVSRQAEVWLPYFQSKKELIETSLGSQLIWNPFPNKLDKIILLSKYFDLENRDNWDSAVEWLAKEAIKFRDVFSKVIKDKSIGTIYPES